MWRLLVLGETEPYANMAVEEALLRAVEEDEAPNTLRLWRSSCSAVVGLSERPEETVNLENCRRLGIPIVRRFTGGGTVYHDLGNLNWAFAFRKNSGDEGKVMSAYLVFERFSSPILEALRGLDVEAEFRAPNALYVGEGKVSGMAMYVKRRSVLCHGTLLVDANLSLLKLALKRLKEPVANVNDEAPSRLSVEDVAKAIVEASGRCLNIGLIEDGLTAREKELIGSCSLRRYNPMN
jgi:lipoate-protein ligase A